MSTSAPPAPAVGAGDLVAAPAQDRSISDVVRQLNESLDADRVVALVAHHARELLGAEQARVELADGDRLRTAAVVGLVESPDVLTIEAAMRAGGRLVGRVAALVAGRPLDGTDERLLAKLAAHAAVAVENARRIGETARAARHAGILAETGRELARRVAPAALHAGVAAIAAEQLGASGVCVVLADADTRRVELASSTHEAAAGAETVRRFWHGPLGAVAASGEPLFLAAGERCAACDCGQRAACACDAAGQPAAILPLDVEGRGCGVLVLRFPAGHRFAADERRLLADFATQVAAAHRNALLVAALERRAARLATVARLQQSLPQADPACVRAELHRAVASVVEAPCVALFTVDDATVDAPPGALRPRLVVVDGRELPPASLPPCAARDRLAAEACRLGRAVREPHPVWSLSAAAPPEPGREWRAAADGLAVPVLHGARVLGVLHVQAYAPGAYGPEDVDLVEIIARQAGAALELARLFDARRQEQELAEVGAEVARIAIAAAGLREAAPPILATLQRLAPELPLGLGVRLDDGRTLEFLAASPGVETILGMPVPFASSIARHLQPDGMTYVPDAQAAVLPDRRHAVPPIGALLVPLVARGRVIGIVALGTPIGTPPPAATMALLQRLVAPAALAVDALLLREEERRRTARERMLATALTTMDQPVLVLSADGQLRYANSAAEREYGWTLDELVGMPLDRLARPAPDAADGDGRWPAAAHQAAGGARSTQQVHRRKDGSEFPAAVTTATIRDGAGLPLGRVLGVRNLTEERRVAEQLRQHEKLAALGSLVAGVAHELNNPLTGISAFSQLLLEDPLPEEQRESVRLIKREADRAVTVIRDLLLFSRKEEPAAQPVDVNALLRLAARLRAFTLRAGGVAVELALDPEAPEVLGDAQRLQQVALNLIVNAEHALHGRAAPCLALRTRRLDGHLVVEVADNGAGITPEAQPHIFEPFFTTKPAGAGTGLGLSVSYGIVQAHGGTITVDSVPGKGSTFRITLPALAPAQRTAPA